MSVGAHKPLFRFAAHELIDIICVLGASTARWAGIHVCTHTELYGTPRALHSQDSPHTHQDWLPTDLRRYLLQPAVAEVRCRHDLHHPNVTLACLLHPARISAATHQVPHTRPNHELHASSSSRLAMGKSPAKSASSFASSSASAAATSASRGSVCAAFSTAESRARARLK